MRPLLCILILLSVLAPLGGVGITASPGDVETQVVAPRGDRSAPAAARIALDTHPTIADVALPRVAPPAFAVARSPRPVTASVVPAQPLERAIGARAPPA